MQDQRTSVSGTSWRVRWKRRFGEKRWRIVASAALVLILAAVGMVALVYLPGRQAPHPAPESPPSEPPSATQEVQAPQEPPEIWAQPTGALSNWIPKEVVFRVSHTGGQPVEVGSIIPPNVVRESIRFTPDVPGTVVWLTAHNFSYQFEQPLQPDKRYEFEVRAIPVSATSQIPIQPKSFSFTTPRFELLTAALVDWTGEEMGIRLAWNLPVQLDALEDWIVLRDGDGTPVTITRIVPKAGANEVEVVFQPTRSRTYVLTLKRGLRAALPGTQLERERQIRLAIPQRELYVSRITAEESGAGYAINVILTVQGASRVRLDRTVESHLEIRPPLTYRVQYHPQGFRILGDFLPEQRYQITIRAGIRAGDALLRQDVTQTVKMPRPAPQVQFAVRGRYLGRNLGVKLPLQVRGVERLQLSIWRIPPENLVWAGMNPEDEYISRQYGEPVIQKQEVPLASTGTGEQEAQLIWLELSRYMDTSEPGIYRVEAKRVVPEEEARRRSRAYGMSRQGQDNAVVIITDLALIAKQGDKKLWVWAVDARTGALRPRAEIRVYSQKNVLMGTGMTNSQGLAEIALDPIRDRTPHLITGTLGDDFTYLPIHTGTLSLAPFAVSGVRPQEANYRAYFYPERNLYRPGETLHFAVLLREEATFRGLSLPVKVRVRDPRGKPITELIQTTDATGLAAFELALPPTTPTGNYGFEVFVGDQQATYGNIFVETFVPERMRVEVTPDKTALMAGEPIPFQIQAEYLFGAPAAGDRYRFTCQARQGRFTSPDFPEYRFGQSPEPEQQPPSAEVRGEGTLDDEGKAQVRATIQDWSAFTNVAEVRVNVEVEEAGSGRVSRGWTHVRVHPFPYYIGLRADTSRITPGRPLRVTGVLVNLDGKLRAESRTLSYDLYEIHYDYVRTWDPRRNRFSWQFTRQRFPVQHGDEVAVSEGRFELTLHPSSYWYDYVLEVRDPDGASVSELTIGGWSWYGEENRPESPERLDLRIQSASTEAPRSSYDFGETLTAEALLPFEGRILWTLELDGVLQHEWQDAVGEVSRFTFTVPQGVTSVYASALLIRSDDRYLVRRAFGVLRVPVRPQKLRLPLTVDVPERIRPGEELAVTLRADGPMKATVAIVDEGILQITRFRTPDVYEGILRDQALAVRTSETLGWIIHKVLTQPGGGEAASMTLEMPSMIRLVSYWSGIVESDASGTAQVRFPVPQYLGRLRVMVAAVDETRLASVEKDVTVTTEVVVLPTVPRFGIRGDVLEFPIALKNTTDHEQQVRLRVGTDSPEATYTLPPGGSQVVWQPLKILPLSGTIEIPLRADWGTDRFEDTLAIPVLPDQPFETSQETLVVRAGSTDLLPKVQGWLPEHQKTRITLTPWPGMSRLNHIKHLVRYPYGCVEQTASSLLPLIRLKPLLAIVLPELASDEELANRVHAGIARLMSMQLPSGAFAFWPGGRDPASPWASVYATFVLLEAREAGYLVPETTLNLALDYIERHARSESFGYFVLARGGRLQPSDLDEAILLSGRKLSSEQRLFLAGALYLGGRPTSAEKVLEAALQTYAPVKERSHYGDFSSPIRNYAVRLYIRELIHPGADENAADVLSLVKLLDQPSFSYSTQELAWATLALGMRIENTTYAPKYTAQLIADGKPREPFRGKQGLSWMIRSAAQLRELRLKLESDGVLYLTLENGGFRKESRYLPVSEGGLSVKKRLLDIEGNAPQTFTQRGLYFVEITLTNQREGGIQNVAVEDFIPAGFEVENPRLPGTATLRFLEGKPRFTPEYVDYRDERVQAFGYLPRGTVYYYYLVRAVTPGTFTRPPVNAVAMYDPQIRASSGVSTITIRR